MFFSLALFSVSAVALLIATFTDLKKRIVPNKLTYSIIVLGLALHIGYAVLKNNYLIGIYCIIATIYAFLFSLLLYKIGVWAGGDVKLFTGIAALNPINPFIAGRLGLYSIELFQPIQIPLFPITLFVFTLFSMFPVTVLITLKRSFKERKAFNELARDLFIVIGLGVLWLYFNTAPFNQALLLVLSLALLLFVLKLMIASRVFLRKRVKISRLEEGMIPAETILEKNGRIEKECEEGMKSFINYVKQYKIAGSSETKEKKRIIADSKRARGVTVEEIKELKELVEQGKLEDSILVKESAPMVPAILVAYIVLNFVGDLLWRVVFA